MIEREREKLSGEKNGRGNAFKWENGYCGRTEGPAAQQTRAVNRASSLGPRSDASVALVFFHLRKMAFVSFLFQKARGRFFFEMFPLLLDIQGCLDALDCFSFSIVCHSCSTPTKPLFTSTREKNESNANSHLPPLPAQRIETSCHTGCK